MQSRSENLLILAFFWKLPTSQFLNNYEHDERYIANNKKNSWWHSFFSRHRYASCIVLISLWWCTDLVKMFVVSLWKGRHLPWSYKRIRQHEKTHCTIEIVQMQSLFNSLKYSLVSFEVIYLNKRHSRTWRLCK